MGKRTDEKNRLMNEVLNNRSSSADDFSTALSDINLGQKELDDLIKNNMEEIEKLSQANGISTDNEYQKLQKEINKDFGIKIEDVKAPIYNRDSKELFDKIELELNEVVLGQASAVKELVIGFRRPFVVGINPQKTRNTIILRGPNGTGRHLLVYKMAGLMKKYGLQHSSEVSKIKMNRYQSSSQESIFLQDLYVALESGAEVITVENFEEGYAPFNRFISELVINGECLLNKRYILKNGQLQESAKGLANDVIDRLPGNNKVFVFITSNKMSTILDTYGKSFVDKVVDKVETDFLDESSLNRIIDRIILNYIEKCKNQLDINATFDDSCKKWLLERYEPNDGIDSITPSMRLLYDNLVQVALEHSNITKAIFKYENFKMAIIYNEERYEINLLDDGIAERENIQKELDNIVGLEAIKNYMYSLEDHIKADKLRRRRGLKAVELSKHMIFTGNPGTGKTTIARLMSRMMKASGVLKQGQLVEVTRADLVGRYVGHTAPLTMSVINSAIGGVLFIDEAYSLYRGKDDSFGLEAIDTLVKAMEDHRDDLIVILAGYSKEMKEFLQANSGLKSRFANIINFPDYSGEELRKIAQVIAESKQYKIEELALKPIEEYFTKVQATANNTSGNGRLARNVVEDAILKQSKRILLNQDADMEVLLLEDFTLDEE